MLNPIRIFDLDYYMASPIPELDVMYSDFRGASIAQVPIVRIFGSTINGRKICLHIHDVFPYLYIPYDGLEDVNILKYQIAANIDKAVNISFGQTSSTSQHIYKITLVSGLPFYGYHSKSHQFLKVFLYNPALVRKVSTMLQSEAILGKLYQPHESHIPYILQFMIDYNLHGMSKIFLSDLKFRVDSTRPQPNATAEQLFLPPHISKESFCELEADALAKDITNRLEVLSGRSNVNPGIAALWNDEKQRKRDKMEDSLIDSCLTLSNVNVAPTRSHLIFKQALAARLAAFKDSVQKNDLDLTVYPAETPEDSSILDASSIDLQLSHSPEALNDSLNLNATLDEDGQNLLDVLQGLGDSVEPEEDSILTQVEKEEDEDYLDLSVPLITDELDENVIGQDDDDEDAEDDLLDQTLVPQLDGNFDSSSSSEDGSEVYKQVTTQKNLRSLKYHPLPVTVSSPSVQHYTQVAKTDSSSDSSISVKRKLSFSTNSPDVTTYEEKLECNYKQEIIETPLLNFEHSPNKKQILEDYFTDKYYNELSKAELYDITMKYEAKEGSSSKLTQSNDNTHKDLHKEASTNEASSNNLVGNKDEEATSINKINLSENTSSGSSSNLITPDQYNNNRIESTNELDVTTSDLLITPQFKGPTRKNVIDSLDQFKIPIVKYEKPFYENVEDVTGSVEVGQTVLKVHSKTTAHLDNFKSTYGGIDSVRKLLMPESMKWTYENIKKLKLSFCEDVSCLVTPICEAPSKKDLVTWLKKRTTLLETVKQEPKLAKTKFYLHLTPSKMDESDMDISLTISPCETDHSPIEKTETEKELSTDHDVITTNFNSRKVQDNSLQITGMSLDNTYGFKSTPENYQNAKALHELEFLTIISMELHICTRGDLKPDPAYDPIKVIFYSIWEDSVEGRSKTGAIATNYSYTSGGAFGMDRVNITSVESEEQLLNEFVKLVQGHDPDILLGFEIEMLSWGYVIDRAKVLGIDLLLNLSRIKDKSLKYYGDDKGLKITGRIILDVWRLLRHEIALQSYTFENIVYHILHRRIPLYSFRELSFWWNECPTRKHRIMSYYSFRVETILKIINQLDLIGRTSELARLFGIQFYEVLSRGSQFRVESMMLRLAKPLNYIPVSPSVQQRATMKAPEFLPLILEPESKLYTDPVIVLDFQSLYPSMMIAYNYCFSTCIGKVSGLGKNTPFEFGATQLKVSRTTVEKLLKRDCLNFSPCGVAFVKSHVRDGILPRMLREILSTRLMVKKSMKENKNNETLQKVLQSRQLGLKLIANVTYGYTAANFSGRMPAVELADSVVSKGRETLQRAISLVENTTEWKAKVVYGDTDSLFVLVPGRSKTEAFKIGQMIAEAVTKDNPDPVKLKLEKVYLPCILQTKKRYVGYMYESSDQADPVYLAKGIETVRRDGCPAVAKMLEKCLRLIFETKNVSLVKKYVLRQFYKISVGRVSLQDLTFAKEYRGAAGYRPGACVPALELARKWTATDKRSEPRSGERVPYVVANGPPGLPLIKLVRSPRDFLDEPGLIPNAIYYITKVIIPPINRCFSLIGVDLCSWYNQLPRRQFQYLPIASPEKKMTIAQYFTSTSCASCGQQTQNGLCVECSDKPQETFLILSEKIRSWEQSFFITKLICQSCTGISDSSCCISLDCPVLYKYKQTFRDVQQTTYVRQLLSHLEY